MTKETEYLSDATQQQLLRIATKLNRLRWTGRISQPVGSLSRRWYRIFCPRCVGAVLDEELSVPHLPVYKKFCYINGRLKLHSKLREGWHYRKFANIKSRDSDLEILNNYLWLFCGAPRQPFVVRWPLAINIGDVIRKAVELNTKGNGQ